MTLPIEILFVLAAWLVVFLAAYLTITLTVVITRLIQRVIRKGNFPFFLAALDLQLRRLGLRRGPYLGKATRQSRRRIQRELAKNIRF